MIRKSEIKREQIKNMKRKERCTRGREGGTASDLSSRIVNSKEQKQTNHKIQFHMKKREKGTEILQ